MYADGMSMMDMDDGWMVKSGSASFDVEVVEVGDGADAGPAFRFHLVEVLHAGQVGGRIRSSGFRGLLAHREGGAHVVHAGDLEGLGALLGVGEEGEEGEEEGDEEGSHWRFMTADQ